MDITCVFSFMHHLSVVLQESSHWCGTLCCSPRYGMMWPGVEPVKGEYNDTYLSASKDIINK